MILLQFLAIKMTASLSYTRSFIDLNQNSSISVVKSEPFLVLSPSSKLLALLERDHISIFDTSNHTQIKLINTNATSAVFDISQQFLFFSNSYSLQSVSLEGKIIETIIDKTELNHISSLTYSPDLKRIYFTNHSKLAYYEPHLKKINHMTNQTSLCPADSIFIDSTSQVLITSSYDCKLCSYSIRSKQPILMSNNTISQCRIGNIVFANGYGFLTQDSITTSLPQIMTLNLQTLAIVSTINQPSAFPLNILSFHNYLLSYGNQDDTVWIYRDSLTNKPNKVKYDKSIIGMGSNTIKNEAYIILGNQSDQYADIQSWKLSFNCSAIQNTANNSASVFLENCNCREGMLFDPSKQICSRSQCKNTKESPCKCPHQQSFNSFTTKCQLDCSQVYNTLTPISFGNPWRCSCKYPFEWNSELSDCSWIDCSLIEHTEPSNFSSKCICKSGFTWNDSSLSCKLNDSVIPVASASDSSVSVGLILGIIFLIILVIISAIIYYVKRYRVSEEDQPKTFEYAPKYEQHNPTPRPLAFENYIRSDCQLAQTDQRGNNLKQLENNWANCIHDP